MRFDWDKNKAASNLARHKVSFEEAATVFDDPLSDTFDDPDHSGQEPHEITIGMSTRDRVLFLSHCDRGDRIRIISARKATSKERKQYAEGLI